MTKIPFDIPTWAIILGLLAACYASGTVLAAAIYMPLSLGKYVVWMIDRHGKKEFSVTNTTASEVTIKKAGKSIKLGSGLSENISRKEAREAPVGVVRSVQVLNVGAADVKIGSLTISPGTSAGVAAEQARALPVGIVPIDPQPREGTWRDWLVNNPTEVAPGTLEIRFQHRELLNTLDRRETLNVMGGSMAAALLAGYFAFYQWHWGFSQIIICGGAIAAVQFLTGLSHLRRVLHSVQTANVSAPPADPNFPKLVADLIAAVTAAQKKSAGS